MISFRTLFDRNAPEDIFPYGSARYIRAIDASTLSDNAYSQLSKAYCAEEMLLEPGLREGLLKALRANECCDLLNNLGLPVKDSDNPWEQLYKVLSTPNIDTYSSLYSALGLNPDKAKELIEEQEYTTEEIPVRRTIGPSVQLFPHQRYALAQLEENFFRIDHPKYRALLHMPTGSGKTKTASMMACRYLLRFDQGLVIWLADTKELCNQAYAELSSSWTLHGDRNIEIFRAYDSVKPDLRTIKSGILVMSLQTGNRYKAEDIQWLTQYEPLVIFDEAHKTVAETYNKLVSELMSPFLYGTRNRLLGLSATPGRSYCDEEANNCLIRAYDGLIISLNVEGYDDPVSYLIAEGYLANPCFRRLDSKFNFAKCCSDLNIIPTKQHLSDHSLEKLLSRIAKDPDRNAIVFQATLDLIKNEGHKRVIVFAASVEQAKRLAFMLRFFGIHASSVVSENPAERNKAIASYITSPKNDPTPKVLCNYNILTTGFDAPATSAVVIARPTNSLVLYSQMVGRALRGVRSGGNKEAAIITVVDANTPSFWDVSSAFNHWNDDWKNNV